jgi:lipoprotein Spr
MSKNLSLGAVLSFLLFIACIPQPRYTSESVKGERGQVVLQEEPKSQEMTRPVNERGKSKIDRKKMGRIIDSFLGAPYKYGGQTKAGIDCSGLVMQVYRQYAGFKLPRSTKKLYQLVKHVDKDALAYGDLVFFSDGWFSVSHVGIYIGEGRLVHSMKGFGVIVSSLDEDYYKKRYRGARRVIP